MGGLTSLFPLSKATSQKGQDKKGQKRTKRDKKGENAPENTKQLQKLVEKGLKGK